jgi:hypothetical protein
VAFTTPSSLNGETITSYTVTSSPGGVTATGASSPITVSGLTGGTSYTFTVVANTASGASLSSSSSSSITIVAITYSDEVFSTYLYTGNGSTQTITNGIDLAGKGGLVWIKNRTAGDHHNLVDTVRGVNNDIKTNSINPGEFLANSIYGITATGFTVGSGYSGFNTLNNKYASWTFRKEPKFFDIVSYTGNGSAGQTISHALGVAPGMIIIKRTDTAEDWFVWHRGDGVSSITGIPLNLTNGAGWNSSGYNITSTTTIPLGNINMKTGNGSNPVTLNASYIAYIFAHDTSATGMIQCGKFTTSGNTFINLGWEAQYMIVKNLSTYGWQIMDTMRGIPTGGVTPDFQANISDAERTMANWVDVNATGFTANGGNLGNGVNFIYMAIRRPNKPPTSGTQVYNAIARTGTGAAATVTGVGFSPDLFLPTGRQAQGLGGTQFFDKLRGNSVSLKASSTATDTAVSTVYGVTGFLPDGVSLGTDANNDELNYSGRTYINHFFKRAPGFFDIVCYTGDGNVNTSFTHNLGAVPEFIIFKRRDAASYWMVYHKNGGTFNGNSLIAALNTTDNFFAQTSDFATFPTLTGFNTQNGTFNTSGGKYVAYLFATLAGVSNVGSYTGNGSSQTINCGFTTGARFILIKRANSTGDWYIWDSVRGITAAANDPHLSLNKTSAEVTIDDSIDPANSGFIVKQNATTNINVTSATYIFLTIA